MSGTVEEKIDWRSMFKDTLSRMRDAGESGEMGARWMATEAEAAVANLVSSKDAEISQLQSSLRDRFAESALIGIVERMNQSGSFPTEEIAARMAYRYADAMLAHRKGGAA